MAVLALVLMSVPGWGAVDYLREVKPILMEHCARCHGASQQKHGLRLDTAEAARRGGENGPVVEPGRGATSRLVQALRGGLKDVSRMPYKQAPLAESQIAAVERWIDEGAVAPAGEVADSAIHWAFVPPQRPEVPVLRKTYQRKRSDNPSQRGRLQWVRRSVPVEAHPIDAFVRSRLDREGLSPSAEADRITLLRRVSLDLTGLPPTPAEVDAFLADARPDAYERVVERLLASPHHGERWGRHWLDLARYADSNGYSIDAPRSIWKYRDWVIGALNRDLPFDQFTLWQIAGDLVDTNTVPKGVSVLEPRIATGFHRNTQINQEGGIYPEQFRIESVMDRVNTTATAWLGVTFACAQCHDHKFDPFTQKEYYQFMAFFNSTGDDGHGKGAPDGMLDIPGETEDTARELVEAREDLDRYLNTKGREVEAWRGGLDEAARAALKPPVRAAVGKAFSTWTLEEKRAAYAAFRAEDAGFKQRERKLARLERGAGKPVSTLVVRELAEPRPTHVFVKGDFTRPSVRVEPGVPAILHALRTGDDVARGSTGPAGLSSTNAVRGRATRLDLARWLVDRENPLAARVLVNRTWQHYFGKGLVETENDFGTQGAPPSHPELLDWLACELMEPQVLVGGETRPVPWSWRHLHRLIVTSETYRQSSRARPDLVEKDPTNRLLARQVRLRVDAEIVRDVALAASGLLETRIGGPGVFPPQPDGVMKLGQSSREWKASTGPDRYRRGLYTFFWRATPHPALMVFDAADSFSSCTRRVRSNTPLQALTLLNDEAFHECARALAARLEREGPADDAGRVDLAFRWCVARPPERAERRRLLELLAAERAAGAEASAAWTAVARVLLNLDETMTRE